MLPLLFAAFTASSTATALEQTAPRDSSLEKRFGIEGSVFIPVNEGFGTRKDRGYGAALTVGIEGGIASFGLQLALHFGPGERTARYVDFGTNLGVLITPLQGPITPVFGGGLGLRYVAVRGEKYEADVGQVIHAHYEEAPSKASFGVGIIGRGGVLFFRNSGIELYLVGEYSAVFIEGTPQALVVVLGVAA